LVVNEIVLEEESEIVPYPVKQFMHLNFGMIRVSCTHQIEDSFAKGRENLIPLMF